MAPRKLTSNNEVSIHDEKPWAKEYFKSNPQVDEYEFIKRFVRCPTGLLVLTHKYKAFIFKGESIYDHLIEALDLFASTRQPEPTILCSLNSKGKIEISVDDEKKTAYVLYHQDRDMWVQVENKLPSDFKRLNNPLLTGRGVLDTTSATQPSEDDGGSQPKTSNGRRPEGSRKASKYD